MSKKENQMYLVNIYDQDMIVDQHVVTETEAQDYVSEARANNMSAIVMKITKALHVNEEGIIVC